MRRFAPLPWAPSQLAFVLALLLLAWTSRAVAEPQVHAGLAMGAVARDLGEGGPRFGFHGGVRVDALLFRARGRQVGVGPYLDVVTSAVRSVEPGGGAVVLLPVGDDLAAALSAGAFVRWPDARPGLSSTLWFGYRGFNFHGAYNLANGLFLQGRAGLGGHQMDLVGGAQIDLAYLAMPFVFAFEAIRR